MLCEVAYKVCIFLQTRVAVRRKHLRVRVYVYVSALNLLKKLLKHFKVVTGNKDAMALDRSRLHLGRHGLAVLLDMGFFKQLHGPYVHLACFKGELDVFHSVQVDVRKRREESAFDERVNYVVGVAELPRVVKISGNTLYGEKQVIL